MLGHSENFCEKAFDAHNPTKDYMYGAWLRAQVRSSGNGVGDKWLQNPSSSLPAGAVQITLNHFDRATNMVRGDERRKDEVEGKAGV